MKRGKRGKKKKKEKDAILEISEKGYICVASVDLTPTKSADSCLVKEISTGSQTERLSCHYYLLGMDLGSVGPFVENYERPIK